MHRRARVCTAHARQHNVTEVPRVFWTSSAAALCCHRLPTHTAAIAACAADLRGHFAAPHLSQSGTTEDAESHTWATWAYMQLATSSAMKGSSGCELN
eukprot:3817813-Prymnesium_polylepis.1